MFKALALTTCLLLPAAAAAEDHHHLRRNLAKPVSPGGNGQYEVCEHEGESIRLMTMEEVQANTTHCNTVFYDRVYWMDEFINVHKGGPAAIERNCGKDATWLFENLQCISMVPDHFEGVLNMCADYVFAVIKGSIEDPCSDAWAGEPYYPYPDFEDCDVYDNITCAALQGEELLGLPTELESVISYSAYHERLWTLDDVIAAQVPYPVLAATNETEHCYTILHDWVYDLGVSPLDGSAPFYKKHGNSLFPWEILKWCGHDMTGAFAAVVDRGVLCAPDHTLGALNVLTGYLVGAVLGSENDPCAFPPPTACDTFRGNNLVRYSLAQFEAGIQGAICPVILNGRVYDLDTFADYHAGGPNNIRTKCGKDVTRTFLSKSFHRHRLFQGTLQDFQLGVIEDSIADPCGTSFDETIDWW